MMRTILMAACCSGLRVLVTGAGGRTGKLVFSELKKLGAEPVGLARSKKAKKALEKAGASDAEIKSVDVFDGPGLDEAMKGCEAVILCTSAVPQIKPWSVVKVLWKKLTRGPPGRPEFKFAAAGTPEEVDWLGAKNQIDAAVRAGVKKFVMCSSMGGTQPDNFLNTIGKRENGSGGDILLWKRKAERYLIASGLDFTIVHPGGLLDDPAEQRELLIGVDDDLLQLKSRSIPRGDVARVLCASVSDQRASNRSFDIASKPDGQPTADVAVLFDQLQGRTCDYSTVIPDPPSVLADAAASSDTAPAL